MENQEIIKEAIHKLFNSITNNYIFIYTPPKVGSTTLVSSLRISLGKSYNIIHIHDEIMLSVLTGINNISINHIIKYLTINGKKVYIIDVYRSPIERKMSEFFEKISCYHFNNSEENLNNYKIERFINRFNNLFPHLANGEHYFDKYEIPIQDIITFDFNKKYTIQVINNINYIKLRLCDSNIWGQILSDIFKQEIIIINDYLTDNKMSSKRCLKCKIDLSKEDPATYITCDECPTVLCAECDKKSNHMVCENDAVIRCLLCHRFHALRLDMTQAQKDAIDAQLSQQNPQGGSLDQDQSLRTLTNNANGTHDARDTIVVLE
jgi:hypothetical protein